MRAGTRKIITFSVCSERLSLNLELNREVPCSVVPGRGCWLVRYDRFGVSEMRFFSSLLLLRGSVCASFYPVILNQTSASLGGQVRSDGLVSQIELPAYVCECRTDEADKVKLVVFGVEVEVVVAKYLFVCCFSSCSSTKFVVCGWTCEGTTKSRLQNCYVITQEAKICPGNEECRLVAKEISS